ncbi:MAG: F0F1 ATP synthase subunit A, partial [Alphaproteobacteria bacterium]
MAESHGHSPLDQFKISKILPMDLGGYDVSLTNSSVVMIAAVVLVTLFLTLGARARALVPGRWQGMAELSYEFVANMIRDNVGPEGRKYFPFI